MQNPRRPRIFISYCREDAASAKMLFDRFSELGAEPWLDTEKIPVGRKWKREISKAIKDSDFFIALLSSRSVNKKGYVQKEIREALEILETVPDNQTFIIPCRLDDCSSTHDKLLDVQRVDLFPSFEEGVKMIARGIELQYSSPITSISRKIRNETSVGASAPSMRVHFEIDPAVSSVLKELQKTSREASTGEVFRRALSLLQIISRETKSGGSVRLMREGEDFELLLPG